MSLGTDHLRLAKRMLGDGAKVPDAEAALLAHGLDEQTASEVVEEALRSNLAATTPSELARSFSIVRVLLGLFLVVVAFIGIYIAFASSPENVILGVGAGPRAIRGAIMGGGGALAVAGVNLVRSELMLLVE